ncbi:MAG: stage V sporulation protein SpoVM [Oscillospiraceae bacterium]|nr:stage V sporulation protein SpoVM [Oscillospiraceae bacterium]
MKIVVVRSPRLLAGFLRMVFGIRKESRCDEG